MTELRETDGAPRADDASDASHTPHAGPAGRRPWTEPTLTRHESLRALTQGVLGAGDVWAQIGGSQGFFP
jgi:hypothetical protein